MTTYTWTPGINGNWLTAADWTTGTIPGATDTAAFQPATGTGSYTVLVSQFDFVNVNAVNLAAAAGAPNAGLAIDGSLNVGTLQYTGSGAASPIDVRAGGLLDIASAITEDAPSLETISVSGNGATLTLGTTSVYNPAVAFSFNNNASGPNSGAVVYNSGYFSGTTLAQTINNFAEGDKLTFANANFTGDTASYAAASTTLTIKNTSGAAVLRMVDVSAPANETFSLAGDTITAVCYAAGTRILTATGERRVENLRRGDLVATFVGERQVVRPVKWIGHRRIDLAAHPRPEAVAPIRIQRGAFADAMPRRDLRVSPDHAILVDGKLVCARQLVNGMTIQQDQTAAAVEYYHVELDAHAILLAEGLPAESYLNTGNDGFFATAHTPLTLHPDLTGQAGYPSREAASVAPFVWDEATVRPLWQRLADRAHAMGRSRPPLPLTADPDLHVVVKGRRLKPLHSDNGLHLFAIPRGTTSVHLVSRVSSPAVTRPWLEDRRSLGVYTRRIVLRGVEGVQEVPLDSPDIAHGWWAVERNGATLRRWTSGEAVLPLPKAGTATILEVHADAGGLEYATTDTGRQAA